MITRDEMTFRFLVEARLVLGADLAIGCAVLAPAMQRVARIMLGEHLAIHGSKLLNDRNEAHVWCESQAGEVIDLQIEPMVLWRPRRFYPYEAVKTPANTAFLRDPWRDLIPLSPVVDARAKAERIVVETLGCLASRASAGQLDAYCRAGYGTLATDELCRRGRAAAALREARTPPPPSRPRGAVARTWPTEPRRAVPRSFRELAPSAPSADPLLTLGLSNLPPGPLVRRG